MDWAFWGGTVVFVTTITGLLVLRRTGATQRSYRRTRRVLMTLLDARDALSGYDLRRRVGASRDSFYKLLDDLADRELIVIDVVPCTAINDVNIPGQRRYSLSMRGRAEARRYQRESSA